ncbi:MAG: hypothetical protein Q8P49_02515 [Candidatus Liptonbacteria bacterium]|nr:hypothetical protein [Candidatus Liptonbacteria bacterium]
MIGTEIVLNVPIVEQPLIHKGRTLVLEDPYRSFVTVGEKECDRVCFCHPWLESIDIENRKVVLRPEWKLLEPESSPYSERLHDAAFVFDTGAMGPLCVPKKSVVSIRDLATGVTLYGQKQNAPA